MKISVIIPTLGNDVSQTLQSIESAKTVLFNDSTSYDIEVIIVDNSINGSKDILLQNIDKNWPSYPVIYEHAAVLSANKARNIGVSIATGELLCFVDDDVKLEPDYFSSLVNIFDKYPRIACLGGFVDLQFINKPKWLEGPFLYMLSMCDWHRTMDTYYPDVPIYLQNNTKYLVGASMTIPKKYFEYVCWDENFGYTRKDGLFIINDEMNVINSLRKLGYIAYSPNVKSYHIIPEYRVTLEYLSKRFYRQGISDVIKATINNTAMTATQLYNTLVLHTASHLVYQNVINNVRQKIQNEDMTRKFVMNYIKCRQSYLKGLTDEIAKIYNS